MCTRAGRVFSSGGGERESRSGAVFRTAWRAEASQPKTSIAEENTNLILRVIHLGRHRSGLSPVICIFTGICFVLIVRAAGPTRTYPSVGSNSADQINLSRPPSSPPCQAANLSFTAKFDSAEGPAARSGSTDPPRSQPYLPLTSNIFGAEHGRRFETEDTQSIGSS